MCGITGFLEPGPSDAAAMCHQVETMAFALRHRGPDDAGAWADGSAGVALGSRRLSILDRSPAGRQPMLSPGGRYRIVFNGEIYNFASLRDELAADGIPFRSGTDTEVLIGGIERWGVEQTLRRTVGMFAFALWDPEEKMLTLARDRLGEKPLYYGWLGSRFLFASELGAFRAHAAWQGAPWRTAVAALMEYGYIPAPFSIYEGIYKLPPGSTLRISAKRGAQRPKEFSPHPEGPGAMLRPQRYWSLRNVTWRRRASRRTIYRNSPTIWKIGCVPPSAIR